MVLCWALRSELLRFGDIDFLVVFANWLQLHTLTHPDFQSSVTRNSELAETVVQVDRPDDQESLNFIDG